MGHYQPLFSLFSSFQYSFLTKLIVNNIPDDWIRTAVFWYWKRPLYQLRHNHCPTSLTFFLSTLLFVQSSLSYSRLLIRPHIPIIETHSPATLLATSAAAAATAFLINKIERNIIFLFPVQKKILNNKWSFQWRCRLTCLPSIGKNMTQRKIRTSFREKCCIRFGWQIGNGAF